MVDWASNVEIALAIGVLGFSLLQAIVAGISYRRIPSLRVLLIGAGFLVFAGKGAFLTSTSLSTRGTETWVTAIAALDLTILLLLYFAIRTR